MPTDKQITDAVRRRLQSGVATNGSKSLETGISIEIGIGLGKSPEAKAVSLMINKTVIALANANENRTVPFLASFSDALSTKSTSKLPPEVFSLSVDLSSLGYVPAKKGPPPLDLLAIIAGTSSAGGFLLIVGCYFFWRFYFVTKEKKEQIERELRLSKPMTVNPLRQRLGGRLNPEKKKKIFIPLPAHAPEFQNANVMTTRAIRQQKLLDAELEGNDDYKGADALKAMRSSSAQLDQSLGELSNVLYEENNDDDDDLRIEVQSVRKQVMQAEAKLKQRQDR
jgi:hypothetical protein